MYNYHELDLSYISMKITQILLSSQIEELSLLEHPFGDKVSLTLRTSYGCVYQCPYCAGTPHWNHYRTRSKPGIEADVDEALKTLRDKAEFIFLDDELFTLNLQHVTNVADAFSQRGIQLEGVLTHTRCFNRDIADQLNRFCRTVIFGAENFNNDVLSLIQKQQSQNTILGRVTLAKEAG